MTPYELPVADESLTATQRTRLQRGRLYDSTSDYARMSQGTAFTLIFTMLYTIPQRKFK
jgi:hypothetical protein